MPSNSPATLDLAKARNLSAVSWLRHAFSTRFGGLSTVYGRSGDLNLGLTADDQPSIVQTNRQRLLQALSTSSPNQPWPLATVRQVHSIVIQAVEAPLKIDEEADGLMTAAPSLFLGVLTADCVPILLVDTRQRVIAAVHAGWRGTSRHLAQVAVREMTERFSSRPKDVLAAVGPSIGPCCYQVGDLVREAFLASETPIQGDTLDLWAANGFQLHAAGLPKANIEFLAQCTACARTLDGRRRFFSYRAEQGRTGRMMSIIGIDPLA